MRLSVAVTDNDWFGRVRHYSGERFVNKLGDGYRRMGCGNLLFFHNLSRTLVGNGVSFDSNGFFRADPTTRQCPL